MASLIVLSLSKKVHCRVKCALGILLFGILVRRHKSNALFFRVSVLSNTPQLGSVVGGQDSNVGGNKLIFEPKQPYFCASR
jgi:hypothetical protein